MAHLANLHAAQQIIASQWQQQARFGIILGTGAGQVASQIQAEATIAYADIPGFPQSTAVGHKGQFVLGKLAGHDVVAMQGRFHLYEGYSHEQVRLPLQLMRALGVEVLFISNASGGLNPKFESGQLMVLESHLDLMFRTWHPATESLPIDRPAQRSDVYDRELIECSIRHARQQDVVLQRGVYAALLGPTYETRAEYRFLRKIGADVVGMSTVPEVVYAAQLGMRVLAFSIVSNLAKPDVLAPTSGQEVVDAASVAAPSLCSLVENAIRHASSGHS